MKENKEDLNFIRGFQKITLKRIAEKLKVPRTAILTGTTTDNNLHRIRKEIEKEYAKLYLEG